MSDRTDTSAKPKPELGRRAILGATLAGAAGAAALLARSNKARASVGPAPQAYETVAAMKLHNPGAPAIALVGCYTEDGDGGGGMFVFDPNEDTTELYEGTYFAPDAGSGRWVRRRHAVGSVSVLEYGAVPNDASEASANTGRIQAALAYAQTLPANLYEHRTLDLANESFYFDNGLEATDGLGIQNGRLVYVPVAGSTLIALRCRLVSYGRFILRNLYVSGPGSNVGIKLVHNQRTILDRVRVAGFDTGLQVSGSVRIRGFDCEFSDNGTGLLLDREGMSQCTDSAFYSCDFVRNDVGVHSPKGYNAVNGASSFRILFQGCSFEHTGTYAMDLDTVYAYTIDSCNFELTGMHHIRISRGASWAGALQNRISHCHFTTVSGAGASYIWIGPGVQGTTIIGSSFGSSHTRIIDNGSATRIIGHALEKDSGLSIADANVDDLTVDYADIETLEKVRTDYLRIHTEDRHGHGGTLRELNASGQLNATGLSFVRVRPYQSASSDTLTRIVDGEVGQILVIQPHNHTPITIQPAWKLQVPAGGITLSHAWDTATFIWDGWRWHMIAHSNNSN